MGYRVVKNHDNTFSRFDTIPACDRQTRLENGERGCAYVCVIIIEFEPVLFPVLDRAGPTLDRTGLGSFFGPSPVRSRRFLTSYVQEKFKLVFK